MRTHMWFILLTVLTLLLPSGCQEENASPTAVTSATPLPAPPTQTPTPLIEQSIIAVPQGEPPTIDGTLSPGEWEHATIETFADGSALLLTYHAGYLYLGIRATTTDMIVGNIFIAHDDEIAILHASAALGTARYQRGADSWGQTQDFVWRCRGTGDSATVQAERDAFLEEEHWAAANARMGTPNELEYQIEMTGDTLRLAANYIRASNPDVKIPWPNDLDDDCTKPTPGDLPAQLHFSPDKWATIGLSLSERN